MVSKQGKDTFLHESLSETLCVLWNLYDRKISSLFSAAFLGIRLGFLRLHISGCMFAIFRSRNHGFLLTLNGKHVANKTARLIQYIDIWLISSWVMVELLSPALVELGEGSVLAPFYPACHWSQNLSKPIQLWKQVQRIK